MDIKDAFNPVPDFPFCCDSGYALLNGVISHGDEKWCAVCKKPIAEGDDLVKLHRLLKEKG